MKFMKQPLVVSLGLCLAVSVAQAGLRFGLGNAVAKRSADLIDKAAAADPANAVGMSVAATLPSCPAGAVYDTAPTDLSMIGGIDPLGHVAPSGHTFPSDHIYFYATTTTVVTPPVYAPGTIHITEVASSEILTVSPPHLDYSLYFYPCRELKSYFFHVKTLSSALAAQLGTFDQNCTTYDTGGNTYRSCRKYVNITLQSGDPIGLSATSGAFDFGTYDYRITPLPFVSANPYYDRAYTVCPVDYFAPGPRAAMQAKLGRFDGGYRRVTPPLCGEINYDIAGTARGNWFHVGSPQSPEDPHLSLIVNNVYAPWQTLSYGTSLPNELPNFFTFVPQSSGHVDRDFSQVTADGTIYCYDTFYDPIGQPGAGGHIFILQMPTATTLRFESQSAATCAAGSWSFTSNAANFAR